MQPTAKPTLLAIAAVQNYYNQLQEIDNDKVKLSTEVSNVYFKYSNVGAGTGGVFGHTSELKPMKYNEAINGPDGEAWTAKIENEHDRMIKKRCVWHCKESRSKTWN